MSIILRYHSVILSLIGHSSKRRPIKTINQMQCNIREEEHQDCSVLRIWYIQAVTWPILVVITGMIFWWYHYWSLGMFHALWLSNDGKKQIKAVFFHAIGCIKAIKLIVCNRKKKDGIWQVGMANFKMIFLGGKIPHQSLENLFWRQFIP